MKKAALPCLELVGDAMTDNILYPFYLRPLAGKAELEFGVPIKGARYRVDALDFARKLCEGLTTDFLTPLDGSGALTESELNCREEWVQKGWGESLDFYDASLAGVFEDESDKTEQIRQKVLQEYFRSSPPPARVSISGNRRQLPAPDTVPSGDFVEILKGRRTVRFYLRTAVSVELFGASLGAGFKRVREARQQQSGDVLELLKSHGVWCEPFIAVYNVSGLDPGLYHYDVAAHELSVVNASISRQEASDILWDQGAPMTAGYTVFLFADYAQYQWLYRHDKGLRNLYINTGLVAQEMILAGELRGLGCFMTPATKDGKLLALTGLPRARFGPVYALTFGLKGAEV